MKLQLIDDWRAAHRYWSARISALGTLVMGGITTLATALPATWNSIPEDLRQRLPMWLGFVMLAAALVSRLFKQEKPDAD